MKRIRGGAEREREREREREGGGGVEGSERERERESPERLFPSLLDGSFGTPISIPSELSSHCQSDSGGENMPSRSMYEK